MCCLVGCLAPWRFEDGLAYLSVVVSVVVLGCLAGVAVGEDVASYKSWTVQGGCQGVRATGLWSVPAEKLLRRPMGPAAFQVQTRSRLTTL